MTPSCYARPGQKVREHLLGVSALAEARASKIGLGAAGALAGLLHDLGKYSQNFQTYLAQVSKDEDTEPPVLVQGSVDHSTAGAQAIWHRLNPAGGASRFTGEIVALCIASHHSGLIDCISPDGEDGFSRRMQKAEVDAHCTEALRRADSEILQRMEAILSNSGLVAGIERAVRAVLAADSCETVRKFKLGLLVRILFSCLIDADRTDTADFTDPVAARRRANGRYPKWAHLAQLLESTLSDFGKSSEVARLRWMVSDACLKAAGRPKGILSLTVPTGGGKTLGSLRFALNHASRWGMDRVVYVSPYTSIVEQNADAVRKILEPEGTAPGRVVLEHHSNLTSERQTSRNKVLTENWDAPVVFTTAVQFLEALFGAGTRAVRRLHQLANAVVIMDEIQTLPVRCVHLFNNAANYLAEQCGSSVVLCTATQPLLDRVEASKGRLNLPPGAEIAPNVPHLFEAFRRHDACYRFRPGGWKHEEAATLAVEEASRARSCLVVVNTKREARSVFAECKARTATGVDVRHLSTAMCPAHRTNVLAKMRDCLKAGSPVICVSTQLIEAGVDISFGSAIRAVAGFDSIAQTAGRCNRHGEMSGLGRVHVVNLEGDLPKVLEDIREGQSATLRILDERTGEGGRFDLSDPVLVEQYFHYYFFERRDQMDYPVRGERDDTLLEMLSANGKAVDLYKKNRRKAPDIILRQAFHSAADLFQAIDRNTQGVIVPYHDTGRDVIAKLCALPPEAPPFGLLRQAQQFSVNVFPWVLKRLQKEEALHETQEGSGILYLDGRYYSEDFGLDIEGTGEMELCHV